MSTPSFRDVEQLSAYLDGQLSRGEAARLETRLAAEPQLVSALDELRQSRALLRQLPQRRAPRNFILTSKIVGQRPPLPRSYPVFRLSTVVATLLLFFTFVVNAISPVSLGAMAPAPAGYGLGGGGAGEVEEPAMALEEAAATEAPAPEAALPTITGMAQPSAEDTRIEGAPTPQVKQGDSERASAGPEAMTVAPGGMGNGQAPLETEAITVAPEGMNGGQARQAQDPIPASWQIALAVLALANAFIVFLMRKQAASQWRK